MGASVKIDSSEPNNSSFTISSDGLLNGGTFNLSSCPDLLPVVSVLSLISSASVKITGIEQAESIAAIDKIEITAKLNYPLTPLPEGDGYLGFIFAYGETPSAVENALRQSHSLLQFQIESEIMLEQVK